MPISSRKKPTHICLTANTAWFLNNFCHRFLQTLHQQGMRVTILAPYDRTADDLVRMGCAFHPLTIHSQSKNIFKDLNLLRNYYSYFRTLRPDLVISYTVKPNIYGAWAARWSRIPIMTNITGLGTGFLHHSCIAHILRNLYRWSHRRVYRVFFQNTYDRDEFVRHHLVRSDQAFCLPGLGIDLKTFRPSRKVPDSDPCIFLFVGRLIGDKGIYEYVKAAEIVKQRLSLPVRFQILGPLQCHNSTAVSTQCMKIWQQKGTIEYLGETEQVQPYIRQADCVVLPSYREGTPQSLLEAAAMAKPIITTDVPGCNHVVEHEKTGFLCRVKDAEDLAGWMQTFIQLPYEKRQAMGEKGRKKMESEFDEALVIRQYLHSINHRLDR